MEPIESFRAAGHCVPAPRSHRGRHLRSACRIIPVETCVCVTTARLHLLDRKKILIPLRESDWGVQRSEYSLSAGSCKVDDATCRVNTATGRAVHMDSKVDCTCRAEQNMRPRHRPLVNGSTRKKRDILLKEIRRGRAPTSLRGGA